MRHSLVVAWLICICCLGGSFAPAQPMAPKDAPAATSPPAGLSPIFTRQGVFAIPFKIDDAGSPAERPTGVQLHVSEDGGASFRLYEQVDPAASKFTFRAPYDGDFQFYVRTMDRAGRLYPETPPAGELRVVVDTLAPRLELTAERTDGGEVKLQWRALDRNLLAESLRVEFQAAGSKSWQAVTVPAPLAGQRVESGELSFWPGEVSGPVIVRAQVVDQAGNPAVAQKEIGADGKSGPIHTAAARRGQNAPGADPQQWQSIDDQAQPGGQRWAPDEVASRPLAQQAPGRVEEIPAPPAAEAIGPGAPMEGVAAKPNSPRFGTASNKTTRLPPVSEPAEREPPPAEFYEMTLSGEEVAPPVVAAEENARPEAKPKTEHTVDALKQGFERDTPVEEEYTPSSQTSTLDLSVLPAGARPTMIKSRRFEFDYEVETTGTVGIAKVEVWGTRDGGKTWSSFGVDSDNRSPVTIAVDQEGLYGFRLVVEAANGLASSPPRSGDTPDLWIAVDRTRPSVRQVEVNAEPEEGLGAIEIRWEASDVALAANPISLFYAEQRSGPWIAIAENLDNVGEYRWKIDRKLPDRVYLRVQARDEAGNLGTAESPSALSLEKLRPQGRIREVRPTQDAKRNTSWNIVR